MMMLNPSSAVYHGIMMMKTLTLVCILVLVEYGLTMLSYVELAIVVSVHLLELLTVYN